MFIAPVVCIFLISQRTGRHNGIYFIMAVNGSRMYVVKRGKFTVGLLAPNAHLIEGCGYLANCEPRTGEPVKRELFANSVDDWL